jgi:hypothetical protein
MSSNGGGDGLIEEVGEVGDVEESVVDSLFPIVPRAER